MTNAATLTGSEKQINWADDIRRPVIDAADAYIETQQERLDAPDATEKAIARHEKDVKQAQAFSQVDDASWWIDQRHAIASQGAECYVQLTTVSQFHCPTCDATYYSTSATDKMKCSVCGCTTEWAVRVQ